MSALLKAGDARAQATVRAFEAPTPEDDVLVFQPSSSAIAAVEAEQRVEDERAELEAVIAELRQRLADAGIEADTREDAAFERGRREGEDLATDETEKRLELLRKGIDGLREAHSERLAEYELLALQLAQTALERVFGNRELRSELVVASIQKVLSATKRELVLSLGVSPRDFRSDDELRALADHFPGLEIAQDEALEAGGCVVKLRLGSIDLGLAGQWQRLTALFEELANAELEA